jgi:putative PIN family toxin of toxin-antitoxin system
MNVVVDTNVFVISLTSKSPYHKIFTALRNQEYSISVSNDILLEYHEVIEQKYSVRAAHEFINLLAELNNVSFINVYYNWHLIHVDFPIYLLSYHNMYMMCDLHTCRH